MEELLQGEGYNILRAYSGTEALFLLSQHKPDLVLLDLSAHTLRVRNAEIRLTKTEYAIMKLLMRNPGLVIAKSSMLDRISLDTQDCTESSLKQHIGNLRRKLRDAGGEETIESVWGIGFRLKKILTKSLRFS